MFMLSLLSLIYLIEGIAALPAGLIVSPISNNKRAGTCPHDLPSPPDGSYDFPHLIVPISKANPDTCYPNSYNGIITPNDMACIFNYDIGGAGQNCELGFFFPTQDQLTTSSFTFDGPGTFTFAIGESGSPAVEGVTKWNNQPPSAGFPGFPKTITMQPGNYYNLGAGPCRSGSYGLTISSPDTTFNWFQDYNPCAIGPYGLYTGRPRNERMDGEVLTELVSWLNVEKSSGIGTLLVLLENDRYVRV